MNSTPQENPDSDVLQSNNSVPPREKSKPGVWLWGSMGCLVFIIIGLVVFTISVKKTMQEDFAGSPHIPTAPGTSADLNIRTLVDTMQKMKAIDAEVKAYRHDKGAYPDNLEQLVPTYLPSKDALHALADSNPDPTHDSFSYDKPTPAAPPFMMFLGVSYTYTMSSGPASQQITTLIQMSLDGGVQQQNTASAPVAPGVPVPGASSN
jgi:hypothetical protein